MPTSTIAGHLELSRYAVESLLAERRPMTANLALRVGKLLGNGPDIWLNMQSAYDLWHAKREVDVKGIPTLKASKKPGLTTQYRSGEKPGATR